MVRVILLAAAFLVNLSARAQTQYCSVRHLSPSRIEYVDASRKIVFIGWVHNMGLDQDDAIDTLAAAEKAVDGAGCSAAEKIFEKFFERRADRLREGLRVVGLLETYHLEYHFDHVGVELSPKEFTSFVKPNEPLDKSVPRLRELRKQCMNLKTSDFHATFPGPEYEFTQRHFGVVTVVPIEDNKIKAKVIKGLSKEALDYEAESSGFSVKAREIYESLPLHASAEDKQRALDSVSDPKQKLKMQRLIDANDFATNSMEERDRAMIENLLKSHGNFAVVVGNAHIDDFHLLLSKMCN